MASAEVDEGSCAFAPKPFGHSLRAELPLLQDVEDVVAVADELAQQHRAWQLQKEALLASWQAKHAHVREAGEALQAWLAPIAPLAMQRCAAAAAAIKEAAKQAQAQQASKERACRRQQEALEDAQRHRLSLARQRLEREKQHLKLAQEEYHRQSEAKLRQARCRLERQREAAEARRSARENERSRLLATLEEERERRLPHRKLAWAQTDATGPPLHAPRPAAVPEEALRLEEGDRGYSDESFESAGSYEKDFDEESEEVSASASSGLRNSEDGGAASETRGVLRQPFARSSSVLSESEFSGDRSVPRPKTATAGPQSDMASVAESLVESWEGSVRVPSASSAATPRGEAPNAQEAPTPSSRRSLSASIRTDSAEGAGSDVVEDQIRTSQSGPRSEISARSWSSPPSERSWGDPSLAAVASVASAKSAVTDSRGPSVASVASAASASARSQRSAPRSPEAPSVASVASVNFAPASATGSRASVASAGFPATDSRSGSIPGPPSEVPSLASPRGTIISHISSHLPEASEIGSPRDRSYSEMFASIAETPRSPARSLSPRSRQSEEEEEAGYSDESFESAGESYEKDFESESGSEGAGSELSASSPKVSALPARSAAPQTKVVTRRLSRRSSPSSPASPRTPRSQATEGSPPPSPAGKVITRRPFSSPRSSPSSPASPRTPRSQVDAAEDSQASTPARKVLSRRPFSPRSSASAASMSSPRSQAPPLLEAGSRSGPSSAGSGSRQPSQSIQSFSG